MREFKMSRNPRGMTLVEIIVAMTVTTVVLLATSQVMLASQKAITLAAVEADLAAQAISVVDRIANEMKDGIKNTVDPNTTSSTNGISFQKCVGYNTTYILSDVITYQEVLDPVRNLYVVRRTENGEVIDLTDSLNAGGLVFNRDPASSPNNDVWFIQVQLKRGNFTVARSTRVQMKF